MGSSIEINDTLKISKERGFPANLNLEEHKKNPEQSKKYIGEEFSFWNNDERLYHRPPTRVFLVEEKEGLWIYWSHALIEEQTIKAGRTEGRYNIIKIYYPEYQEQMTKQEAPEGKSYFKS